MLRQDRQVVEEGDPGAVGGRERYYYRARVRGRHRQWLPVYPHGAGEEAFDFRIVERLEGEEDIRGRQWRAVRPGHSLAKRQCVTQVVGRGRPAFGEPRFDGA